MENDVQTVGDILRAADERLSQGLTAAARTWSTGFEVLDTYLSGGLRSGELTLLGGPQGLGKTTFALQMLRNAVANGDRAIYFSYEHDSATVLERLLAMEAAEAAGLEAVALRRIREEMQATTGQSGSLADRLADLPGGREAVAAVAGYGDRLLVHRSTGGATGVDTVRELVSDASERSGDALLVVVDYLQKMHVPSEPELEEERVTRIVEGLKDLALNLEIPVLAIVAADKEGITAGRRLRVHHLRGSSALAYEADVVLLMNDKYDVVARHHLVYDVGNAERFREWVVVSIEKNRTGLDKIDLEFRKRFEHARFERDGAAVGERLIDERVFVE